MTMNSKKLIPLIAVSLIALGSSKCFAQDSTIHDFGVKYDQTADKTWTVRFTDEVDDSVIKNSNISVLDEADNTNANSTFTKGTDNKSIIVTPPSAGYKSGHTYLIDVKKDAKSAKGKNLKREAKLEFKVVDNQQSTQPVNQQLDANVKFIKAMGEKAVVVEFNNPLQQDSKQDAKILDANNNDITSDSQIDYNNNSRNLIIRTKTPMYTPDVYKVKIGDKTYNVSAVINKADAVRVLSAEAVGEKIIKLKLNRPIEDCDLPEIPYNDNKIYSYSNISNIDSSVVNVVLRESIYKGDVCSLNIGGKVFNVEGTIDDTTKVKAVSIEQATDAPGKINIKLNRECFRYDRPSVKITDEQGQELTNYTDYTDYDVNKDVVTVKIKNPEKQIGNYKLTVGDSSFDISLKAVTAQALPNITSVQAITPKILKITYDKEVTNDISGAISSVRDITSSDNNTNIYANFTNYTKNIVYERLNSDLVSGHNYVLTYDNKDFKIDLSNYNEYSISVSNIGAVDESTIKYNLKTTLPTDMMKSILIDVYNEYGRKIYGSSEYASSEYVLMTLPDAVFKPDAFYLECNGNTYDISSVISKNDALKVTSMSLAGDKTLSISFNKKLNSQPYVMAYNYYDNYIRYDYGNTKISGSNSYNLAFNDSKDIKNCKVVINGTCYYVNDYIK